MRTKLLNRTLLFSIVLLIAISAGCANDSIPTNNPETELEDDNNEYVEEIEISEEELKIREWEERNERLKNELGELFVPLPPVERKENPPVVAKGIYLSGHTAGNERRLNELIDLVNSTELNSMVIDVKCDSGHMTYKSEIEFVKRIGADRHTPIKDIEGLIDKLNENDIYPIARVVIFKDPYLPEQKPELGIQRNDGGVWRDNRGPWVNPYNKKVWDYNIAIAKEAALKGFREIQLDYVRFPENAARVDREAYYPGEDGVPKDQNIQEFIKYAKEQLEDYNVYLSADTFGVIATSWGDSDRIGQSWEKIAPIVDYNCPMIYPSHYGANYFGFPVPDANPYGTVYRALVDSIKRNAPLEEPAIIRPWLQAFTARWIKGHIPYGANEIKLQIDAARDLGINEYLIWNPSNYYIREAFLSEEESNEKELAFKEKRKEKGLDTLGRTKEEALDIYLRQAQRRNWREIYSLQITDFNHHDFREWFSNWSSRLISYESSFMKSLEDKTLFTVDASFNFNGEIKEITDEVFQVIKQNEIWRVKPSAEFLNMLVYEDESID